jgi:hypothetical protein
LSLTSVGGAVGRGEVSVVVDSVGSVSVVVVSVESVVVSSVVVVSVDPVDSVDVSVVVESDSAASGPAPETTPADTRPAAKSAKSTNET